jgi:hypothetical protein
MTAPLTNMNPRERRLLGATVAVVLIGAAFLGVRGAIANLSRLNGRIDQLELELENLHQQFVQRGVVDAAYNALVTEHSSNLTVAQIHDHLLREIFELSRTTTPAAEGQPETVTQLVTIPTLEMGELKQGAEHREYRIQFDVPVAPLGSLLAFLQRIETSDQLLRIDRLEIGRSPGSQLVHASIEITRTVLDNPESADLQTDGAPT